MNLIIDADPLRPINCIKELHVDDSSHIPRYPLERGCPFGLTYQFGNVFNCFASATLLALFHCPNMIRNLKHQSSEPCFCGKCSLKKLLDVFRAAYIHGMTVNPFERLPVIHWQTLSQAPSSLEFVHQGVYDLALSFREHMQGKSQLTEEESQQQQDVGEFLLYLFFNKAECPHGKVLGSLIDFHYEVKYDCDCKAKRQLTGFVNVLVSKDHKGLNLIDIITSNESTKISEKNRKCGICSKQITLEKASYGYNEGPRPNFSSKTIVFSLQGETEQFIGFPFRIKHLSPSNIMYDPDRKFETFEEKHRAFKGYDECEYELRSIVRHSSSGVNFQETSTRGHYTTYVKFDEKWYEVDGPGAGQQLKVSVNDEFLRVYGACYAFYDFVHLTTRELEDPDDERVTEGCWKLSVKNASSSPCTQFLSRSKGFLSKKN